MKRKLAFMTIGQLHEEPGHPRVQGFIDRVGSVYAAADNGIGFVTRSERQIELWRHSWGPVTVPDCYGGGEDRSLIPSTLSLWDNLESVAAYAYHGAHGEALGKRKDWFATTGKPAYVAWWVDEGETLNWEDAAKRLDHLHVNGSTAFAFNFQIPFDADGAPTKLDVSIVKSNVAMNTGVKS